MINLKVSNCSKYSRIIITCKKRIKSHYNRNPYWYHSNIRVNKFVYIWLNSSANCENIKHLFYEIEKTKTQMYIKFIKYYILTCFYKPFQNVLLIQLSSANYLELPPLLPQFWKSSHIHLVRACVNFGFCENVSFVGTKINDWLIWLRWRCHCSRMVNVLRRALGFGLHVGKEESAWSRSVEGLA